MPEDRVLERHRKHLEQPPEEFLAAKLELLGISRAAFEKAPPIVVRGRRKRARIEPKAFEPAELGQIKRHVAKIAPKSLAQLKELTGVPDRALARDRPAPTRRAAGRRARRPQLREVDDAVIAALPADTKFGDLEPVQREAVWNAGHNLLYGPATAEVLDKPGYTLVASTMLELAANLTVFYTPDLIVEDRTSVFVNGFGTLYFNNVIVYGDGGIWFSDNVKLHAYAVKHL